MNTTNKISEYLTTSGTFYLSTMENNKPRCRPISFHTVDKETIYFGVGNFKDVYKQITENPFIEICASDNTGFLRLYGEVVFETNYDLANKVLETQPMLQQIYNENTGYKLELFHLKKATAEFRSLLKIEEIYNF